MAGKDQREYPGRHTAPPTKRQRAKRPLAVLVVFVLVAAAAAVGVSFWPKGGGWPKSGIHGIWHSLTAGSHKHPTAKGSGPAPTASGAAAQGGKAQGGKAQGGKPQTGPGAPSGPAGVTASWVKAENAKQGTSAWIIPQHQSGAPIEGYADHVSASAGATVNVYVNTTAPKFHIEAYRLGYYGGAGGRLVWTSPEMDGVPQAPCPVTTGTNMVECDWIAPVSVPISSAWVQGDYFLDLVADPGQRNYVPLTVIDPASHATYLIDNSVFTWEAWNPYGGDSLFGPTDSSSPTAPERSRVVSYDRPYAYAWGGGDGSADFLGIEYPFVRYAEQHGLDIAYLTDIDLTEQPQLASNHKVVISLGHNEFWSAAERQGALAARDKGVNLMFLGATPALRPARLQPSALGPDRELVDYRNAEEDPISTVDPALATANSWSVPPLSHPPSQFVGNTYGGYGIHAAMVVVNPTAWPFAGLGLSNGSQIPAVIGGDYDRYQSTAGQPTDIEILAHSPVMTSYGHHDTADMIYYSAPSGAGVFSTGTIAWIPSLTPCGPVSPACAAPLVQGITGNVLSLFGQGPAGRLQPSTSNVTDFYAGGSGL